MVNLRNRICKGGIHRQNNDNKSWINLHNWIKGCANPLPVLHQFVLEMLFFKFLGNSNQLPRYVGLPRDCWDCGIWSSSPYFSVPEVCHYLAVAPSTKLQIRQPVKLEIESSTNPTTNYYEGRCGQSIVHTMHQQNLIFEYLQWTMWSYVELYRHAIDGHSMGPGVCRNGLLWKLQSPA